MKIKNQEAHKRTYGLNDRPPLGESIALGFQHVAAMFAANLAVAMIIASAIGMDAKDITIIIQGSLFAAGVTSFVQSFGLGPVGARLPVMMGATFTFVSVAITIGGDPSLGYGAFLGACIVGGLVQALLGPWIIKWCGRFLTPVVTGAVVLAIGISLLSYGVNYAAGGSVEEGYGSLKNLLVAAFVLVVAITLNVKGKGFLRACSIFIGMIAGYILAICLGMVDLTQLREYAWFSLPKPFQFGISFRLEAIAPCLILYFASMMEFVGDTTGVAFNAAGRLPTEKELRRGVICDGLGSAFSCLFNCSPNVSFSQNVGLIRLTGVKSRFVVSTGGLILVVMAFIPKLAAIFTLMPYPVLGGACILMFAMIAVSGIQVITTEKLSTRDTIILAASLGIGMGFYFDPTAIAGMPSIVQTLLTGISGTAVVAILLNIILPKKVQEDEAAEERTEASC